MAAPFINSVFTFTQPDGTTFQVRGSGNQYSAEFETLDGYAVVRDEAGFFRRAQRAEDGSLAPLGARLGEGLEAFTAEDAGRAVRGRGRFTTSMQRLPAHWEEVRARRMAVRVAGLEAPPTQAVAGNYLGLVLPIRFKNEPTTLDMPLDDLEKYCNQPGYTGFGNNGSVRDYFYEMSAGRLTYTNRIAPYYTTRMERSHYNDPDRPFGERSRELLAEALAHHKANGFSFAGLTLDEKDRVRAINMFYTGASPEVHGFGLWPHMGQMWPDPFKLGGGRYAHEYQITNMGTALTLGTFCHETGHMVCDFPDLYDYYAPKSRGAGCYCLMAHGNYANDPSHVGAYLKRAAGWATKTVELAPGLSVSLRAGKNELAIWRRPGRPSEYYLIENRTRVGRDKLLYDSGLAIWRIDEEGDNRHESRTPQLHYECALMQADGKYHLEQDGPAGDNTDLYRAEQFPVFNSATNPNSHWWDGTQSGLAIYDISAPGEVMTFKVR